MSEEITVRILNWNCLKNGQQMAIAADSNNNLVLRASSDSDDQKWTLIPNLVSDAAAGGYTFVNVAKEQSAERPQSGQQVRLANISEPYGNQFHCWTLFDAGEGNNEQLWAIQTFSRGEAMDAEGGSCSAGAKVILFAFRGRDNQKWVIRRV